ncbi:uncharacterized protein LAESUDRAFT_458812 [Laetiporus sulphureus 93-53]|uniref:Uncharacterized protein n=1 Tax=Laetiporus sulphureus 93-53 TaxID=1314785 RepID=A0A165BRG8_9APHY|nr:uncharacterized protein LAESUDRAFT_458812 [Laetiporus sulphureus 93-53]KZT01518.1 hypothetical protein LAESUDRAFT_458812 [Laetiporus sulphureus 93-53]
MDTLLVSDSQPTDFEGSQFDGSPNPGSPFDSFEFAPEFSHPEASFPHTPSYNGSYQNSPYSILSDLPSFDDDHTIGLFDPSSTLNLDDYDPSSYDAPSSSGLFTLDDNFMSGDGFPQVSITPPAFDQKMTSIMVDHGSPASSNGGEDDTRSHASSTSSYQPPASPHLNFESLRFDSPAFSPAKLPSSPPSHKASPPQLMIPPSPSPEPPTINAPSGDGVMSSGPQLHIVPATPVSGGGDTAQPVLFQTAPASGQYCHSHQSLDEP